MATAEFSPNVESNELSTQLADIAHRAIILTGGDGAAVALCQAEGVITVASSGDCAPDVGVPVRSTSFAGRCVEARALLVCDDTETDGRVDAAACRVLSIRSMVAAPIQISQDVRGVIAVFAHAPRAFINGRVGMVRTLAAIAAEMLTSNSGVLTPAAPENVPEREMRPAQPAAEGTTVVHIMPGGETEAPCPPEVASATAAPEPVPVSPLPAVPEAPLETVMATAAETSAEVAVQEPRVPTEPVVVTPAKVEPRSKSEPAQATAAPIAIPVAPATVRADAHKEPEAVAVPSAERAARVPAFATLESSEPNRSRRVLLVACVLLLTIAGAAGGWRYRARLRPASTPITAPAAMAPLPTPVTAPSVATPIPAPAVTTAVTTPAPVAVKPASPTVASQAPRKAEEPKPEPIVLRASGEPRKQEQPEPEVSAPTLTLGRVSAPDLPTGKAYVPSAPTSELTPPQLLRQVAPVYPPNARSAGAQGTVVLNAQILKNGTIGRVSVLRGDVALRQAAVNAVKQWTYKPAALNGQPTESTVVVDVNFNLRQK